MKSIDVQRLLVALRDNQVAGEDKEEIGEAVDVAADIVVHRSLLSEGYDAAFGTAAHGASDVALSGSQIAARDNEIAELGDLGLEGVDGAFHSFDSIGGELRQIIGHLFFGSQESLDDEKIELNLFKELELGVVVGPNHFG